MKRFSGWLVFLFSILCGYAPHEALPQMLADPLRVHFIDVGQGDGILIQTPDGAAALIDSGYDNGLALAYLQQQSIQHLNAVIASHPHADHIGGLMEVMQAILMVSGLPGQATPRRTMSVFWTRLTGSTSHTLR
jgi:beta-lactamase superfamily II metal-dependent hydrolase